MFLCFLSVCMCAACVCVCVRERERERPESGFHSPSEVDKFLQVSH